MISTTAEWLRVHSFSRKTPAPMLAELLRRPGGLEGLLWSSEVPERKHLALLELEHPSVRLIDHDPVPIDAEAVVDDVPTNQAPP